MATSTNFPAVTWIYDGSQGGGDWPSFSPDGSQVVFVIGGKTSYALYTINIDGSGLTKIYPTGGATGNGSRPDWSWNAGAIAFTQQSDINTNFEAAIWTVAPDGSGAAPYNPHVDVDAGMFYPSWNEDLQSLVAVGYSKVDGGTQASLFVLTPSSVTQITQSPNPVAGRPSWSLNGGPIAFAGNQGAYNQVQNQIWVCGPQGQDPQRVEPGSNLSAIQGRSPNWSPDGNQIVFESTRPAPNPTTSTPLAIWVMNSDGTDPVQLTDPTAGSATHPEWSRQQNLVVFSSKGRIGVINIG